ncbi:AdeC/AdeK/OprM family multidrug efflux complex outer membrane factor [Methylovorus menthalis]|uniref:AdeC/AdeK/OprM family multidrug efflux complex outer membrane factor n=1 Tax=Methylovorus menthalis TaxID=1002227 RepID=UPI001E5ECD64|nr:AdeC/AdeK/OprM family multidrug efflux complex outer membrane factor [Methylovorus menthalis]MCB4810587.1 AdeC/AdeK/OprM family multidrug efflux complex outer membrane factor [Methylovorus menthalis]
MKYSLITQAVLAAMLAGCASMAPDYQRPAAPVAEQWPAQASDQGTPAADIGWREFLLDSRLQQLVELALQNNRDLRVAALNIEQARAEYQVQRADLFPTVNVIASRTAQLGSASTTSSSTSATTGAVTSSSSGSVSQSYRATVGFSAYELDFWGRIRSLNEQALQSFFATEEARRSTHISLVSEVASAWLTLAADMQRLKLAQDTLQSQQASYDLTKQGFDIGVYSALELRQIQISVETARGDVANYRSQVKQDQNALALLLGQPVPDNLLPQSQPDQVTSVADLPAGIPSEVLQRRPDILQAEHSLQAANANIGAARAAFFPTITLTTTLGSASNQLSGLFASGSKVWSFAPQLTLPIFDAGRNRSKLKSAEVAQQITVAQYEKAIQSAFKEVADALAIRENLTERMQAQQSLVEASQESYKLSDARFRGGIDSYLAVLDSQRTLYSAQQTLITVNLTAQTNQVTLYKVLGGGWNESTKTNP